MQVASFKFIAVAALSLAAAAASVATHAETYDGVHPGGSMMSREAVVQGAMEIARAGNVYGEAAGSGVTLAPAITASRADVRREAIATTRLGNPYGEGASAGNVSKIFAADRSTAAQAQAFVRGGEFAASPVVN